MSDKIVRLGIIGVGGMGASHADYLIRGAVPGAKLAALCDIDPARIERNRAKYGDGVQYFDSVDAMLAARVIDAAIIATPHYDHPPLSIKCFEAGLHVMSEKPAGVYTRQVREMNAVAAKSGKVFGVMFNQRTVPAHQKMRDIVQSGELGKIRRTLYVITNWLRSQAYYDSGGWRGTWAGEGGGVLMNQCPHNLDLFQWICGMPSRVRAFCRFGQYHHIEVDDDVTAYVEYPDGGSGVFITTTGEAPGVSTMEVIGERGRLVLSNDAITFYRLRESVSDVIATTASGFPNPETWVCTVPGGGKNDQHRAVTENWISAIRNGTPLLAPGEEGIFGLTLGNAMLLSTWTDNWVNLPIDEDLYYQKLQERITKSTFKKNVVKKAEMDVSGTFGGVKV